MRSIESERQMRKGIPSTLQCDASSHNAKWDAFGVIVMRDG